MVWEKKDATCESDSSSNINEQVSIKGAGEEFSVHSSAGRRSCGRRGGRQKAVGRQREGDRVGVAPFLRLYPPPFELPTLTPLKTNRAL